MAAAASLIRLLSSARNEWQVLLAQTKTALRPSLLWSRFQLWLSSPQTAHALHLLAILLLVFAVVLSVLRFVFPVLIDTNRDRLLNFVSAQSGYVIQTKALHSSWHLDGPAFHMEELTVRDAQQGTTILRLGQVRVRLGLLDLLMKRKLMPTEVAIEGLRLAVIHDEDGLRVFGVNSDNQSEQNLLDIGGLLLQPSQLSLTNTRILFTDQTAHSRSTLFDPAEVLIHNNGNRHRLSARLGIDGGARGDISLAADIRTKGLSLNDWSGELYLLTSKLDLAWLAGKAIPGHYALERGASSFEVWASWQEAGLTTIEGRVSASDIRLSSTAFISTAAPATEAAIPHDAAAISTTETLSPPALDLDWVSGFFRWRAEDFGWRVDLASAMIRQNGQQWPTRSIGIALRRSAPMQPATLFVGADTVKIEHLLNLLALQNSPSPAIETLLKRDLRGQIQYPQLALSMQQPLQWHIKTDIENLATAVDAAWPGINNLRGVLVATHAGGYVHFDTDQANLDFPRLFRQPFNLERLSGTLAWHATAAGWVVATNELVLRNHDIDSVTHFQLRVPARSGDDDAVAAPHLQLVTRVSEAQAQALPTYLPARIMRETLVTFLDSAVEAGTIRDGLLVIDGPVNALRFNEANNTHLDLSFQLHQATVLYQSGWPAIENIDARFRFYNNQFIVDVTEAQLYETRSENVQVSIASLKPLAPLVIRGKTEGDLDDLLRLLREAPLPTGNNFAQQVAGTGQIRTQLDLAIKIHSDQPATRLGGSLAFTNNSFVFNQAGAMPLRLDDVNGQIYNSGDRFNSQALRANILATPLAIALTSDADTLRFASSASLATAHVKSQLPALANVPIDGESLWDLQLAIPRKASDTGLLLEVKSDLVGSKVSLPLSLAKDSGSARALRIQVPLTKALDRIIDYGNANLRIKADGKRGTIRAPQMAGTFQLPATPNDPFQAELDYLHLAYALKLDEAASSGTPADPRQLPAMRIRSQELTINNNSFGRLDLSVDKLTDGLEITRLSLNGEQVQLRSTGTWQLLEESHVTNLELTIEAERLGDAIAALGLKTEMEKAPGSLDAKLSWPAAPQQFSAELLNGTVSINAGKGTLLDTEPGFGRLIGLANIRALQRRLTLDFSDFAKQGFAFDSIDGTTSLNNGIATTERLRIKAPAGDIIIRGSTNLQTRQLDQYVTVTPQIHGTLPLAGVLAGGPALGAALLVAGTLLGDEIDRIAKTEYRISGDFNDTVIERLDNAGRVIEEVAPASVEKR